jgi:hypothetical protein
MNRRTAMMLTMLLGGLVPRRLLGQEGKSRRASSGRSNRDRTFQPVSATNEDVGFDERELPSTRPAEDPPAGFTNESGFQWRNYDISRYCRVAREQQTPQKAILDWIFRRTVQSDWHGEKVAVLCASKAQVRAYNSPEVLKQVGEIIERFTDSTEDVLSVHVQFFVTEDTRWRYTVFSQLTPVGNGPQGQQIWTMRMSDAALVMSQMQVQQGFRKVFDERIPMVNGQLIRALAHAPKTYAGGMQREAAAGQGFVPRADKLEESIELKLSPLLTFEGDAVDAAIELTVNSVRGFHRTKVIAPREMGPPEMAIDVPEVSMTHLDQTVKNWPLGQSLLVTGGIHPGVLEKKGGWLGTPIGAPSSTEVLVFLDVETVSRGRSRATVDDRTASATDDEDVPARTARKPRRSTRGRDLESELDPEE